MQHEVQGTMYVCDACENRLFVSDIDTPPTGAHITTLVVYGGGDSFTVYSCKLTPSHMGRALAKGYERFQKGERE